MRTTEDLCQDCWQEAHPYDYAPTMNREGTCARCGNLALVHRTQIEQEEPMHPTTNVPTTRTSTVNLTLTIVTPGGVPADLTAAKMAQLAEQAVHPYLTRGSVVTGTVSSAFIVRTELGQS